MEEREDVLRATYRPCNKDGNPLAEPVGLDLELGTELEVGRDGELPVGLEPSDEGISRVAMTVIAAPDGWQLTSNNRNGAVIHRWAQQPEWTIRGAVQVLGWPRVAVRLIGSDEAVSHWVLLEADRYATAARSSEESGITVASEPPEPLTRAQLEAVGTMFGPHLAWPPVLGPIPLTLDSTARRLGVSSAAVYQRLQAAQQRAYRLGSHEQLGVTDPDYLYVLVAHGYLPFPTECVTARDLYGAGPGD